MSWGEPGRTIKNSFIFSAFFVTFCLLPVICGTYAACTWTKIAFSRVIFLLFCCIHHTGIHLVCTVWYCACMSGNVVCDGAEHAKLCVFATFSFSIYDFLILFCYIWLWLCFYVAPTSTFLTPYAIPNFDLLLSIYFSFILCNLCRLYLVYGRTVLHINMMRQVWYTIFKK